MRVRVVDNIVIPRLFLYYIVIRQPFFTYTHTPRRTEFAFAQPSPKTGILSILAQGGRVRGKEKSREQKKLVVKVA